MLSKTITRLLRPLINRFIALVLGLAAVVSILQFLGIAHLQDILPHSVNTVVTTTATRSSTATNGAGPSLYQLYMTRGMHAVMDSLNQPSQYQWDVFSRSGGRCEYREGAYRAEISTPATFTQCLIHNSTFTDFLFQAKVQIITGDEGGLVIRANKTKNIEYHFDIATNGEFDLIRETSNGPIQLIPPTPTNAIYKGLNAINQLAVLTQGNDIYLFVNQHQVTFWQDSSSSSGAIGFLAYDETRSTDVAYQDADVWAAPPGY
jgi:hypothetical protein